MLGPKAWPAVLALAVHNTGILGRLGGEATQQAAIREVREEAGLTGRLGRCMGELYVKENHSHTTMYALHVEEELSVWDESSRERRWFSLGVPGSPRAGPALDAARAQLSPKRVHQHFFARLVADAAALMRECEATEQLARECRSTGRGLRVPRRRDDACRQTAPSVLALGKPLPQPPSFL